jgi:exonuclease SbcC
VCGSVEHPNPAKPQPDAPTAEAVDKANALVAQALTAVDTAREVVAELSIARSRAEALVGGADETSATTQVAAHARALTQIDAGVARRDEIYAELATVDESCSVATTALTTLATQREHLVTALGVATESVNEMHAILGRRDDVSLSIVDEQHAVANELAACDRARHVHTSLQEAEARITEINGQWERTRSRLTIADDESFANLVEAKDEIAELRHKVAQYDEDRRTVRAELARLAGDYSPPPASPADIAASSSQVAALTVARDELAAHIAHLEKVETAATRHFAEVVDAVQAAVELIARHQATIRMAEIASASTAENQLRIPLATYVLMERFRSVLAAANSRLQEMSNGRYTLEHHLQLEGRGRKTGLGISIRDHFIDAKRSAGDLSGGETFYTSLALALGLADVVIAESGGVDLGTLFIDEGFGLLDCETLDTVLVEIDKLRAGGRVIGLVSHVEELKQRISERIATGPPRSLGDHCRCLTSAIRHGIRAVVATRNGQTEYAHTNVIAESARYGRSASGPESGASSASATTQANCPTASVMLANTKRAPDTSSATSGPTVASSSNQPR